MGVPVAMEKHAMQSEFIWRSVIVFALTLNLVAPAVAQEDPESELDGTFFDRIAVDIVNVEVYVLSLIHI